LTGLAGQWRKVTLFVVESEVMVGALWTGVGDEDFGMDDWWTD